MGIASAFPLGYIGHVRNLRDPETKAAHCCLKQESENDVQRDVPKGPLSGNPVTVKITLKRGWKKTEGFQKQNSMCSTCLLLNMVALRRG
jgi:hypothetical protein